jgi:hypothetical protein
MLEGAIRPGAVEAAVLERQSLRVRSDGVRQAPPPCLLDHHSRRVGANDARAEPGSEREGVVARPSADFEVATATPGIEQLDRPLFVRRIERLLANLVENPNPRLRVGLRIHVGERMLAHRAEATALDSACEPDPV